ncbi:MAG: MBL fold metallo-hydrolase [Haliea sp.]|jgi:hydroxyacylglutathione hydrolase
MSIQVTIVPVTAYQQNCSIIKCLATGRGAVVDPGGDVDNILEAARKMDVVIEKILLTHGHMDHCAASDVLRQRLGVKIEGPQKEDDFWIAKLPEWCKMSGFPHADAFVPDRWLEQGDTVTVGEQTLQVFHCPGHTPGHVVFLHAEQRVAWVGDVLFQGSIGRTDFPRGDHAQLLSSIRERLFPLGDDITFVPGHGPTSTFGQERRTNPFVADARYG